LDIDRSKPPALGDLDREIAAALMSPPAAEMGLLLTAKVREEENQAIDGYLGTTLATTH
jgi:hypothetical protein